MSFDVAASAYDRFMGRYSRPLASVFADWIGIAPDARVLDVGCGPGALTEVLVERVGATSVAAIEPSETFVAAVRERLPGVDVRLASAEDLPFAVDAFDAALAQLVVHFMTDAAAGAREMTRVTRPGGTVAACVWDLENERAPHTVFLRAVAAEIGLSADPLRAGTRRGDLAALLRDAGCRDVVETELTVTSDFASFDDWWSATAVRVGPIAAALDALDADGTERVRAAARRHWGDGAFTVSGTAWAARGVVP